MTETEWQGCTQPGPLLTHLLKQATARKARLFGCGYLRQVWPRLEAHESSRRAVEVVERFVDRQATEQDLVEIRQAAAVAAEYHACRAYGEPVWQAFAVTAADPLDFLSMTQQETGEDMDEPDFCDPRIGESVRKRTAARYALYLRVLRDIFSNPFRPLRRIPASVLSWCDDCVVRLARAIYDERTMPAGTFDNQRLAVLADALEEAGLTDEEVLKHCREEGAEHVRGCWVVDLLLGKD